ncbi:hypothetical protein HF313_01695 [Massilia atriviolacea]|uniref:Uncharacterized protein n=1 Tax=Massilia atriviolacea TaxID=2495579 RepID=A0A430HNN7_9BURK|nr:hypothetical protein [Massilia atriviolacea]RSZ59146.1 hypothetical protein EJB06_08095 [Massilia atriviolacea]
MDKNLPVNKVDGSAHLILWISIGLSTAHAWQPRFSRLFFCLQKSGLSDFSADSFFLETFTFCSAKKNFSGFRAFGVPASVFQRS